MIENITQSLPEIQQPQEVRISKKTGKPVEMYLTRKHVLDLKLKDWSSSSNKGRKTDEKSLTDFIDIFLPELLKSRGLFYKNIAKEFDVHFFRVDYLIKLLSGEFLIIEVKNSKREGDFVSGLGQLLAYRSMLSIKYKIKIEKIKMFLFINKDSLITLSTILDSRLPIEVFVVYENGIKNYGKIQNDN